MLEIENMEELFIEESDWSDSLLGYVEVKEEKKHLKAATTSTVANVPRHTLFRTSRNHSNSLVGSFWL